MFNLVLTSLFQRVTILIDLEKELKEMCIEYDVSEKEVLSWFRGAVRSAWGNSPFKRKMEETYKYQVVNNNPRNMKKYPIVSKIDCWYCGKSCSTSGIDLDHVHGNNKLTSMNHVEDFIKSILFVKKDGLQWLCGDGFKTVNKKKVTTSIGCHSVKTQMDLDSNLTKEQAYSYKEANRIERYECVVEKLKELGVTNIPTTKVARRKLLESILLDKQGGEVLK